MNKKEFMKSLTKELNQLKVQDVDNILEYFDELIEDKKENGMKEKDIINDLSIYEIIKNIKAHKKIDEAVKKPTLSNGMKALIAFLSILSLPMLIGLGILMIAIFITVAALMFALILTAGSLLLFGGTFIIALTYMLIIGNLPVSTFLFFTGSSLILIALSSIFMKWSIEFSKDTTIWFINILKNQIDKRKGGK